MAHLKRNYSLLFIISFLLFAAVGCQSPEVGKDITQGKVEFDVNYPELDSNNVLVKFLPDEMEMLFKDNSYSHIWQAGLGLFRTGYAADCNTKDMTYMLKLINVKYKSGFDSEGINVLNGDYPEYTATETRNTKLIAGYTCHEVLIDFPNGELQPFAAWYTKHLKVKDVNWCNPLHKVPGVMLEYQLTRYDLTMKFTANEIIEEEIDPEVFKAPKDYETITNKRMEYKIRETFFSFQQ